MWMSYEGAALMWLKISQLECQTDDQGFHIGSDGRRTTKRYGIDSSAYRCNQCGVVGYIDKDYSFIIHPERTETAQRERPIKT